jgi:hypothetical protein
MENLHISLQEVRRDFEDLKKEIRIAYKVPVSIIIIGVAFYGYFLCKTMDNWLFLSLMVLAVQPLGFPGHGITKFLENHTSTKSTTKEGG